MTGGSGYGQGQQAPPVRGYDQTSPWDLDGDEGTNVQSKALEGAKRSSEVWSEAPNV